MSWRDDPAFIRMCYHEFYTKEFIRNLDASIIRAEIIKMDLAFENLKRKKSCKK